MTFWKSRDKTIFAKFHQYEERIAALESGAAKQRLINEDILTYVEAEREMASVWMAAAKLLSETLREALQD